VKRRLRDVGLLGRVAKKKPYLRLANKKVKMGKRTDTGQRNIGGRKCYGIINLSFRCSAHKEEHCGGNVMVWGCFGGGKVGDLYKVEGILKEGCDSILQCHAILSGQCLIGANFLLQQDNDSKHSSKHYNNYLGKKQSAGILSIMEWPAL
jgi:hypothetical protein